jgi:Leucine-rich repeat (LRR) protein
MPSRLAVVLVSLLLTTPAVIFWMWLVILSARYEIMCPEECRCETQGILVNCSHSGLNSIPSNIPTHARLLLLEGNNISYIENGTFVSRGLVELELFYADKCKLRIIELGAFNGLTKFLSLSMQGNALSEIIPGTFEKMNRLQILVLSYNIIEHLQSDVFNGLGNLKFIALQGNKLQYLHTDTFLGLSKFQGLQMPIDIKLFN